GEWLIEASPGKEERLEFLLQSLGLKQRPNTDLRYQLLHRAASAIVEGLRYRAAAALFIVHSFSPTRTGWSDYTAFLNLFGVSATLDQVQRLSSESRLPLFSAWICGNPAFLSR